VGNQAARNPLGLAPTSILYIGIGYDPSAYHVARLRHHPVTLGYTCSIRPIEKGS
jgi:hypothetical protein